jgi:hypothetical protein
LASTATSAPATPTRAPSVPAATTPAAPTQAPATSPTPTR